MSAESGAAGTFGAFVARAHRGGHLVVQPRMGMSSPRRMRAGLLATRYARATTVGTMTVDSFTRVGELAAARDALAAGAALNGYPIVTLDTATTRGVLDGVAGPDFPVQIRHGSPCPERIFRALMAAGLHATEGGPVSYCLPYSRTPLAESVRNWARACEILAQLRDTGAEPHLESFGGCMMGQLCPPSLLIALSVLECMFFRQHGIASVSLSYAQQTSAAQDTEAVAALQRLAAEWLPGAAYHVVIYAYMGVYPRSRDGALRLLADATRLAVRTGAARLIVKTAAEAHRIPSIADNVAALEAAGAVVAVQRGQRVAAPGPDTGVYAEAQALIHAVLSLGPDLGSALTRAFQAGYLDVPYCLHPDNAGRARSFIDETGALRWSDVGAMPLRRVARVTGSHKLTASALLEALGYVERKYDGPGRQPAALDQAPSPAGEAPAEATTS